MKALLAFCERQARALLALLAVLVLVGFGTGLRLPASILPEIAFPRITVIADSGERPAEEMVRTVTRPLEEVLRHVPEVREIRSATSRGSTEIHLDCAWRVPMARVLQQVQAQVEAARIALPAETNVEARWMSPAEMPVLGFALTSRAVSPATLRDFAVTQLVPALTQLPGVARVVVQGGERMEARVALAPAALVARGLDANTVADAIKKAFDVGAIGQLDANGELYLGLADARPSDLDALRRMPVPLPGGGWVALSALGTVSLERTPEFTSYASGGGDAVLVNLLRKPSGSTVDISSAAHRWLSEHARTLPAGVRVETWYDQADLVRDSVRGVRDSLLVGALCAILVVVAFLRSVRLGLTGALVLPLAIGLTFVGLAAFGQTLNMMTLGGIAAAVGLVLDDAIVVVEQLAHRRASGVSAGAAMGEIASMLVGSSLCTLAIFIPFVALSGLTGAFFRVLALAIAFMLIGSLLVCLLFLWRWAGGGSAAPAPPGSAPPAPATPGRFARAHERGLAVLADRPLVSWAGAALLVAALWPLAATMASGFLPEMDEGSLILDYVAPPGSSVSETTRLLRPVEEAIAATPEIAAWSRRTGDQLGFFITEPNSGDFVLRLKQKRKRTADEVADALRDELAERAPGLQVEFGQLVEDVVGDLTSNPQPIEVRVLGEDRVLDRARAEQIAHLLASVRGVVDAKSGVVASGPNLVIAPAEGAARSGLSAAGLTESVAPYVHGVDAGILPRGSRAWPVRVTLPFTAGAEGARALADALVPVAPGRWSRLGDLATVHVEPGETEIARDDQHTMISVTARLSGRDLGSAMREIQQRVGREVSLPSGMSVRYAGQWADQQESFRDLLLVLVGAVCAVFLVMLFAFRSWGRSGAALAVALASLATVFVALRVTGQTLNIASFVGAIMVVGIVAENAYFLVAAYGIERETGAAPREAARRAAHRRARPVLMTTTAGVAALLPLALQAGAGGALLSPLAVAVIGGFAGSALLLLFVLPACLGSLDRTV
jgi:multidrug efflux pump subunit AcrB